MPIVSRCTAPGCDVLTIGPWCVEHDHEPRPRTLPRGKPFPPVHARLAGGNSVSARLGLLDLDADRTAVAQRLGGS